MHDLHRILTLLPVALSIAMSVAPGARAEVSSSTPSAFVLSYREELGVPPDVLWRSLVQLPAWWSDRHTYSGRAANLSLDATAGGCWCERFGDGRSVEHGRVLTVLPGQLLRIVGALGPLQELPVQAVLGFQIAQAEGRTELRVSYRVAGDAGSGLERWAPIVDRVIGEQVRRLKLLAETGRAD